MAIFGNATAHGGPASEKPSAAPQQSNTDQGGPKMAATQAQRAALFNTLAELMSQQDAETLINGLPPSDWDNMATSDDLNATSQILQATFAAAIAESNAAAAESNAAVITAMTTGFAHAAQERAEILKKQAWHAYAMISTIVLAGVSIWIALLYGPSVG